MLEETFPEMVNGLITIIANEPGMGRLEVQSPPPQRRRVSEASVSIADLTPICGHGVSYDHHREFTVDLSITNNPGDDSDGYSTPDEESGEEPVGIVGDHTETTDSRRLFTTPCGQTYWVDDQYLLYTNINVEYPIGYWSDETQSVVLDMFEEESDDEYQDVPLSPAPPIYRQSSSEPDTTNAYIVG